MWRPPTSHWICLFPQHGPGRKHERKIELTGWQQDLVDLDPRPLLRGLLHSDGCRVLNWVKGTPYPRYHFSNVSPDIPGDLRPGVRRAGDPVAAAQPLEPVGGQAGERGAAGRLRRAKALTRMPTTRTRPPGYGAGSPACGPAATVTVPAADTVTRSPVAMAPPGACGSTRIGQVRP
jgi:hypothetical protein